MDSSDSASNSYCILTLGGNIRVANIRFGTLMSIVLGSKPRLRIWI